MVLFKLPSTSICLKFIEQLMTLHLTYTVFFKIFSPFDVYLSIFGQLSCDMIKRKHVERIFKIDDRIKLLNKVLTCLIRHQRKLWMYFWQSSLIRGLGKVVKSQKTRCSHQRKDTICASHYKSCLRRETSDSNFNHLWTSEIWSRMTDFSP